MKDYFLNLFAYERWANGRILAALEEPRYADERCLDLFSHIIAAQQTWLSRVLRQSRYVPLWERHDLMECAQLYRQVAQSWDHFLTQTTEADFAELIAYRNTRDEAYETPLRDILAHLINHDTYHRGQLVEELKVRKLIPTMPVTDYIVFVREIADLKNG
ncbi:MAG: DinB family protein [Cytophagaceae bacterium]|nr:DinB family protein [Cytophagaceae bacterium]